MTRNFLSLAMIFALSLAGCGKNKTDSQNPDAAGDAGDSDGAASSGDGDAATTPSRARGSTTARSGGRHTVAKRITAKKPPRTFNRLKDTTGKAQQQAEEQANPNGLLAEAFALKADTLPEDFSVLGDSTEKFFIENFDFDEIDFTNGFPGSTALKEYYALRFSGSINIVEEAEYELCLHSDDGSQLLLEGMLVVDNNGVHDSAVEACELVYLAAGEYMLEVRYFQASGPLLTLHMAWAINGGDKVIVPTDVLFKPDEG